MRFTISFKTPNFYKLCSHNVIKEGQRCFQCSWRKWLEQLPLKIKKPSVVQNFAIFGNYKMPTKRVEYVCQWTLCYLSSTEDFENRWFYKVCFSAGWVWWKKIKHYLLLENVKSILKLIPKLRGNTIFNISFWKIIQLPCGSWNFIT